VSNGLPNSSALIHTAALLLFFIGLPHAEATEFIITNSDGPGEGFNDSTPVAPVAGNPGTTLGQQRLNVFERAADIWSSAIDSDVPIRVEAAFDPLTCSASSAILGSAGPIEVIRDFTNAPQAGTWYHTALANALAGSDLVPGTDDISATFNSSVDNNNNCLTGTNWYLGFDHNPSAGINLLVVLLHEFAHGLGFSGFVNLTNGRLLQNLPDVFSSSTLDNSTGLHWNQMSNGQRRSSAKNTGNLVWDGAQVRTAANGLLISGQDGAGNVRLYAPNPVENGSSIYHFDTVANPNLLMEPSVNNSLNGSLDLSDEFMQDLGWLLFADGDVNGDGNVDIADLLLLEQAVTGQNALDPDEQLRADLYPDEGDNVIEIADLFLMEVLLLNQQ